jgi:TPR repeat protein
MRLDRRHRSRAQFRLAISSSPTRLEGRGVPRDPAEAVRWYRKLADQDGYESVQLTLAVRGGIRVEPRKKDLVRKRGTRRSRCGLISDDE